MRQTPITRAMLDELRLLAREPQPTFGAARGRIQNVLVANGLARYTTDARRDDRCEITEAGRAVAALPLLSPAQWWALVSVAKDKPPSVPSAKRLVQLGFIERVGSDQATPGLAVTTWLARTIARRSPYELTERGRIALNVERVAVERTSP